MASQLASETAPNVTSSDRASSQVNGQVKLPAEDVLNLGKGVSLSLRGDMLIVKDKTFAKLQRSKFCGVPLGAAPAEISIPLYNVLWAEVLDGAIVVNYTTESKNNLLPTKLSYSLDDLPAAEVAAWTEELLSRAYGQAQRRKRAKVLVNPHAGPGDAEKIWEQDVKPLFEAAHMVLDIVQTTFSGEAIGLCEKLDIDAYDVVIPCSGDGLAYEVFNGLGKRSDARRALRQLAVAHIPCGSGNAMSCNLNGSHRPSLAALAIIKGVRTPMDLVSITQGEKRLLSFLSQSLGIIAECDLGTENLRWMGPMRFNVGMAQRIFSKKLYPCDISVKVELPHKDDIKAHYGKEQSEGDFNRRREADTPGRGSINGASSSSEADTGDGLPPLKYGTINDKVPGDWQTTTHEKLGNFYCGNMAYMAPDANFFAAACANDGLIDMVISDGDISAMKYVDLVTSVETGHFYNNPLITYRKVSAYRIIPRQAEGYISIDGERIPFEPFQAEIHQGLATVLSKSGKYEAPGPKGWEVVAANAAGILGQEYEAEQVGTSKDMP